MKKRIVQHTTSNIASKLPLINLLYGVYRVSERLKKAEGKEALLEGVSAIVSSVPGYGIVCSLLIDGLLINMDLAKEGN